MSDDLAEYVAARDEMLMKLDPLALIDFQRANNLPVASSVEVAEVTLHKTISGVASLPAEMRAKSIAWLKERGYSHWGTDQ
jgi:hypothetical protein